MNNFSDNFTKYVANNTHEWSQNNLSPEHSLASVAYHCLVFLSSLGNVMDYDYHENVRYRA